MITLSGIAAEIRDEIEDIPVVDCHEHLDTEEERTSTPVDVTTLFSHYLKADLEAAGLLQGPPQDEVFDTSKPLEPRWKKLKPYVDAIRYGSYAYPAFTYVRDVLEIKDINDSTYREISDRLEENNTKGVYKRLIQDLANIECCIQCKDGVVKGDQDFFYYLCRDRTNWISEANIQGLEQETDTHIHTIDDYTHSLNLYIEDQKKQGTVGLKIGAAYGRSLEFTDTSKAEAERIFVTLRSRMRSEASSIDQEKLENYLIRREIEAAIDNDMCIVIHTGYHAGNKNDIRNSRATLLWPLLTSYPEARFDLFHGSFPYVSDMTVLGKYFENVCLNMCWMHIMGPYVSRRALHEWLDAVPVTKIFAFGGDYRIPEKIYGHLQLAIADVSTVLAEKIERGRFQMDDAVHIAKLMFNENPKRWYRLE